MRGSKNRGERMSTKREVITGAHWGLFYAQVENDQVVGVRPFERDNHPSPMIEATPDLVHSELRITAPMVRQGYLEKGHLSDTSRRGAEPFVEVSWDQALDVIHAELQRVFEEHGNESLFAGSYGWGSAGKFHSAQKQLHRFLNLVGGFTFHKGNYSAGAVTYLAPHLLGDPWFLFAPTSWASIAKHTELFVCFGGLPPKNMQADQGGVGVHDSPDWLARTKAAGADFINIGPIADDMDQTLAAEWLALRPNTDTALMLALCHTLYTEQLWDESFVNRYCVGFEQIVPYLMGSDDGQPKTADWAAAITEVSAEQIRTLARKMAASRTIINVSLSIQRADHGEQPYWAALLLAAMLGQIGLPGGGIAYGYGAAAGTGVPRTPVPAATFPVGSNPVDKFIPVARISDALLNPGAAYQFNGKEYHYPDIRAIWWAGGNPFHHHQDLNRLLRAWQKAETVIVNEPWWTPVARYADIVLPVTTSLERNDFGGSNFATDRYLFAMQQAVSSQNQARDEYAIFSDLAGRFGLEAEFTEGRDAQQWLEHLYDQTRQASAKAGIELPEFEQFWQTGYHEVPPPQEPHVAFATFRADPVANPLRTPSGKFELFSETIAGFNYDDCPGHPVWLEPAEWLGSSLTATYPLHLISNQPKGRLHSQFDPGRVSQQLKVAGREPISMHPVDAARRGLADGELIEVFNSRGACLAGLKISDQIRPGVVQISTGAWFDPLEPGVIGSLDNGGNVNMLTLDKGTSQLTQAPISQTTLVEVRRYEGDLGSDHNQG